MPFWKVLLIVVMAAACFSLFLATIIVPITLQTDERWIWLGGLAAGTLVMGTLFTLFLRSQDRTFKR